MTFTPRDLKDVSSLVAKKLELYMNQERREERFDTQGRFRTHPKMKSLDLMYQMLDSAEMSKKGHHKKHRSSSSSKGKVPKNEEGDGELDDKNDETGSEKRKNKSKDKRHKIAPKVVNNSLRVVPQNEAERLTQTANKVFEEQDFDKLHVIHRYRPNSRDVAPITENGKVANYTLHVGSALHSKNYVDYYIKEGLQSSKKEYAKRLQRLDGKKDEIDMQHCRKNGTHFEKKKGQCEDGTEHSKHLYNPLVDQSAESLLSTSFASTNLTPLDKCKPTYQTNFPNNSPSSRASSEKLSKASSQLYKARRFANGYGYRIVKDSHSEYGLEDPMNRIESRAEIASSEEYCKFSSVRNHSLESGREGDGCEDINKNHVQCLESDLDYNRFKIKESSFALSGLEEDDSRARSFYNNSCPPSQRSARSVKSYQSIKSSSIYCDGSMSVCTEESDLNETSKSEADPETARSISYPISEPIKYKKVYKMQPIQTLITAPEVPPLRISSDMNDSVNSCTVEEYMTAEEKAQMDTDSRAQELKNSTSQERADDGILANNPDNRADRSVHLISTDLNQDQLRENIPPDSHLFENLDTTEEAVHMKTSEADQIVPNCAPGQIKEEGIKPYSVPEMLNTERSQIETDINEDYGKAESVRSEKLCTGKKENLIDFKGSRHSLPSDNLIGLTKGVNPNRRRAKEMEGTMSERGEDKVENLEFHRGQVPEVDKRKLLKTIPERGDDTPRTMAAKGRLTKSAKKRGMSNYYTMGEEERGLEKEHFALVDKDAQEMYVKSAVSDDEEDLETPESSRSSTVSGSSKSTKDSDHEKMKKANDVDEMIIGDESKDKIKSNSQAEKSLDGRGDDSVSIRSGSNFSPSPGKQEKRRSKYQDDERVEVFQTSQDIHSNKDGTRDSVLKDVSGGSRGSQTMHLKLGIGEGYCLEGEVLVRGYDENINRVLKSQNEKNDEGSANATSPEKVSPLSQTSERSIKSEIKEPVAHVFSTKEVDNSFVANQVQSSQDLKSEISVKEENTAPEALPEKIHESHLIDDKEVHQESQPQKEQTNSQNLISIDQQLSLEKVEKFECNSGNVTNEKHINIKASDEHVFNDNEILGDVKSFAESKSKNSLDKEKADHVADHEDSMGKNEQLERDSTINVKSPESAGEKGVVSYEEPIVSEEIPTEEKAFIACDLSDHDVVKEAVSGSASMFIDDNDTVIDFRPSSASTTISVGKEMYADHKRMSFPQPKIAEVTEVESVAGSARESQRSSKAAGNQDIEVVHPATVKKRRDSKEGTVMILNIADVKLEQAIENKEVLHPSIKRKLLQEEKTYSRSNSLPAGNGACEDIDQIHLLKEDDKKQNRSLPNTVSRNTAHGYELPQYQKDEEQKQSQIETNSHKVHLFDSDTGKKEVLNDESKNEGETDNNLKTDKVDEHLKNKINDEEKEKQKAEEKLNDNSPENQSNSSKTIDMNIDEEATTRQPIKVSQERENTQDETSRKASEKQINENENLSHNEIISKVETASTKQGTETENELNIFMTENLIINKQAPTHIEQKTEIENAPGIEGKQEERENIEAVSVSSKMIDTNRAVVEEEEDEAKNGVPKGNLVAQTLSAFIEGNDFVAADVDKNEAVVYSKQMENEPTVAVKQEKIQIIEKVNNLPIIIATCNVDTIMAEKEHAAKIDIKDDIGESETSPTVKGVQSKADSDVIEDIVNVNKKNETGNESKVEVKLEEIEKEDVVTVAVQQKCVTESDVYKEIKEPESISTDAKGTVSIPTLADFPDKANSENSDEAGNVAKVSIVMSNDKNNTSNDAIIDTREEISARQSQVVPNAQTGKEDQSDKSLDGLNQESSEKSYGTEPATAKAPNLKINDDIKDGEKPTIPSEMEPQVNEIKDDEETEKQLFNGLVTLECHNDQLKDTKNDLILETEKAQCANDKLKISIQERDIHGDEIPESLEKNILPDAVERNSSIEQSDIGVKENCKLEEPASINNSVFEKGKEIPKTQINEDGEVKVTKATGDVPEEETNPKTINVSLEQDKISNLNDPGPDMIKADLKLDNVLNANIDTEIDMIKKDDEIDKPETNSQAEQNCLQDLLVEEKTESSNQMNKSKESQAVLQNFKVEEEKESSNQINELKEPEIVLQNLNVEEEKESSNQVSESKEPEVVVQNLKVEEETESLNQVIEPKEPEVVLQTLNEDIEKAQDRNKAD